MFARVSPDHKLYASAAEIALPVKQDDRMLFHDAKVLRSL